MEILINNEKIAWESDYPVDWKFSAGDPFKFPVIINGQACFIKRFETKTPEEISGWQLLQQLKGITEPNLPRVFDIKEVTEKEDDISYVFYEYIEGATLEKVLYEPAAVNLRRLVSDIFHALEAIHRHGYWFADFCEKNIFCEKSGRYLLVDLDSTQPWSAPPSNEMYGSKDYWIPVYKFYKEVLNQPDIVLSDISGTGLDYLQAVFLILHVKLFKESGRKVYRSDEDYNGLPAYLNTLDPEFRNLFLQLQQHRSPVLSPEQVTYIKSLIENRIINYNMSFTTGSSGDAVIHEFKSSKNMVKEGEPFTISWKAEGDKFDLYRNGALLKTFSSGQQTIERTEFLDSTADASYELAAYKNGVQVKSKPVVIRLAGAAQVFSPQVGGYLLLAAPWAVFIAVVGMVISLTVVLLCLVTFKSFIKDFPLWFWAFTLILSVLLFFSMLFLFRFGTKIKPAIDQNQDVPLGTSFKQLKSFFTYLGYSVIFLLLGIITTIIVLAKLF